jgi:hypothetical protein
MAGFSNYAEQAILDYLFGGGALTKPTSIQVGLHVGATAPDMEAGTGVVEPSGLGYARKVLTNDATSFANAIQNAGKAEKTNSVVVDFPQATGDWGTATHFVIYDNADNVLAIGALSTAKDILAGDTASFAAGALKVTLD